MLAGRRTRRPVVPGMHRYRAATRTLPRLSAQRLLDALCLKHRPTAAHSLRVALGSLVWSERLELCEQERRALELAALVHDVGKLAMPDHLLSKRGRLTPDEMALMNRCRQAGFDLVGSALQREDVDLIILGSRTWFDGSQRHGTLYGTPLAARVLAIADAFDAMTTCQVYRPALTRDQAVEELWRNAGTQFDPDMVRRFAELAGWDPQAVHDRVDRLLGTVNEFTNSIEIPAEADSGWPPLELADPYPTSPTITAGQIGLDDTKTNRRETPVGSLAAATDHVRGSFEITAAKLRGFISDEAARVLSVDDGRVCLAINRHRGRVLFGMGRRRVPLRIDIELVEFRGEADDASDTAGEPLWTRINIDIRPHDARRRRLAGAKEHAKEVLGTLRSYLMAGGSRSAVAV